MEMLIFVVRIEFKFLPSSTQHPVRRELRRTMTFYGILLFLHVVTAVGGLGQLTVITVLTRPSGTPDAGAIKRILRAASGSLVVMLITGVALMWQGEWASVHTGWWGISMVLFLALGALLGMSQGALRKATAADGAAGGHTKLNQLAIAMSVVLVLLVFFMEARPF